MEPYYEEVRKLFSWTPTPSADGKFYLMESGAYALVEALAAKAPCKDMNAPCGAYPDGFLHQPQVQPASGQMGHPHVTAFGGVRQSTATLLQAKALSRDNYQLSTESEVTRIWHENGVAKGLEYVHKGEQKTANLAAGGLLLLSAGPIQTPRLLLSNGIGDPRIVGKDLSDHGMMRQMFYKRDWGITPFTFPPSEDLVASYIDKQTGPLAQFGPLWTAFIKDPTTPGLPHEYDVEVFINPATHLDEILVYYVLMRPTCSKANLLWNGTAVVLEQDNYGLYFHCERDIKTMQYARDVITARMESVGAECKEVKGPNGYDVCGSITVPGTTRLRSQVFAINHHAGTCPLQKCVDEETLRVHGSENIAVADASILPGQVWGHPAMTLTALSLRAADLLVASLQRQQGDSVIE
jgi:choline dehydrogenase